MELSPLQQRERERKEGERFVRLEALGGLVRSRVYAAEDTLKGGFVAVKRTKIDPNDGGIPESFYRELNSLRLCQHPNVLQIIDMEIHEHRADLILELMDVNLHTYMKRFAPRGFKSYELRHVFFQIVTGLHHCHALGVLHRDLNPQNILVNRFAPGRVNVKLADFSLSRSLRPGRSGPLTEEVVTLWYRAPELLLGEKIYGNNVDCWSLGCIFAELSTGRALFPGDSEIGTIFLIFQLLGTPTEAIWPGVTRLKFFKHSFPQFMDANLKNILGFVQAFLHRRYTQMLRSALCYNPIERPSAKELLKHSFFAMNVLPELWALAARISCSYLGQRHPLSLKVGLSHKGMALGVRTGEMHLIDWAGSGDECVRKFQGLYNSRGSAPTTDCLVLDVAGLVVKTVDADFTRNKYPLSVHFIRLNTRTRFLHTHRTWLSHFCERMADYLDINDWFAADSLHGAW